MSTTEFPAPSSGGGGTSVPPKPPVRDRVHWRRIHTAFWIWVAILEPILWFVIYPHLPPGRMTLSAHGDQFDTVVATMVAGALIGGVVIYFVYAFIVWREPKNGPRVDGPPLRGHMKIQTTWVAAVSLTVLGLFVFGTYELIAPAGAGTGEGPHPIWATAGYQKGPYGKDPVLPVQVIGQQWQWTFRWPTLGGMETNTLVIPDHTAIAFHVTSLDVVHDWWNYQLSIKADANPGEDNVAFTTTTQLGHFTFRCDELCGIWHGAMFGHGVVVTKAQFQKWATSQEKKLAPVTKYLPKFAWTYYPSANGAGGGFYPSQDPFYQYYKYYAGYHGREDTQPGVKVKPCSTNACKGKSSTKSPFLPPNNLGNPFTNPYEKGPYPHYHPK